MVFQKHVIVCVIYIFLSLMVLVRADGVPLRTRDELPFFEDADESIEVFYLEAPLFKERFGDTLESLNGFHGGVGFRSSKTGKECLIEYVAGIDVLAAVLPKIEEDAASVNISWGNIAEVYVSDSITASYWSRSDLVSVISGNVFNKFACWAPTYLFAGSQRYYQLFNVYSKWGGTQYIHASTCVDFVWSCFQALYDVGADLDPVTFPRHDFVNFYTNQTKPEQVDMKDLNERKKISQYYDLFQLNWNKTVSQIIADVLTVTNQKAYVFVTNPPPQEGGIYYRLDLAYPYVGFLYEDEPMTSGTRKPDIVPPGCVLAIEGGGEKGPESLTTTGIIAVSVLSVFLFIFILISIVSSLKYYSKTTLVKSLRKWERLADQPELESGIGEAYVEYKD